MPFMTSAYLSELERFDYREETQKRIKHYHDLYFSLKKRKDLRRKAKSRLMKDAEKNWQLFKGVEQWERDFWGGNIFK